MTLTTQIAALPVSDDVKREFPASAKFAVGLYSDGSGPKVEVSYDTTEPTDPRADCRDRIWIETSLNDWIAVDQDCAEDLCDAILRAAKAIRARLPPKGQDHE